MLSRLSVASAGLPEGLAKPLFPGKYMHTHPYYFPEITPVLEPGKECPCLEEYSSDGFAPINNALQRVGGWSLEALKPKQRQILEDLILKIQVEGKHVRNTYRGISNPLALPKYLKFKKGDVFVKGAFMSTSVELDTSQYDFANWDSVDFSSVLLIFLAPPEVRGMYITEMAEWEILYPPRTGFVVRSVEDDEDVPKGIIKRTIYANLFLDPLFKELNLSGASASASPISAFNSALVEGRVIRDPSLMDLKDRGA